MLTVLHTLHNALLNTLVNSLLNTLLNTLHSTKLFTPDNTPLHNTLHYTLHSTTHYTPENTPQHTSDLNTLHNTLLLNTSNCATNLIERMDSRAEGPGPVCAAHRTQLPQETALGRTQGTQAQAQVYFIVLRCAVLYCTPYCAVLWRNVLYRHANLIYCTVLHCALLESTASKYTHFPPPDLFSSFLCFPSLLRVAGLFS
jgi:hypothetical protein